VLCTYLRTFLLTDLTVVPHSSVYDR